MVLGREATPKEAEGVARLKEFWTSGEGGKRIGWGQSGDFRRCETEVQAAIVKHGGKPMSPSEIAGYCATLHKMATGAVPGHAPAELAQHAAEKAAKKGAS